MKIKKLYFIGLLAILGCVAFFVPLTTADEEESEMSFSEWKHRAKYIAPGKDTLAGLDSMSVVVEPFKPEEEYELELNGLTQKGIQTDVEHELRNDGVKVSEDSTTYLYVNVDTVFVPEINHVVYTIRVGLNQEVLLLHQGQPATTSAETWRIGSTGICKQEDLSEIQPKVLGLVREFVNDYRAADQLTTWWKGRDRGVEEPNRIEAVVGRDFVIALGSNPSTGYSWRLARPLPRMLKLQDKKYIAAEPQLIGGGGTEEWTFRPVRSGKATIVFEYVRPWEKEASPVKQRRFFIVVKKKSIGAVRP
jgi:predicted secreted protein